MSEAPRYRFTVRQRQVLALVADGLSYKAIAAQLGLSPRTVEAHATMAAGKLYRLGYDHLTPKAAIRQFLRDSPE